MTEDERSYEAWPVCAIGAFSLLISEAFLDLPGIGSEDHQILRQGLALSWQWVEGSAVDPISICEYIDGDIGLPVRSCEYAANSVGRDIMMAATHAIGLVALLACDEVSERASESVENFGVNEWSRLNGRIRKLPTDARSRLSNLKSHIDRLPRTAAEGKRILSRAEWISLAK